MAWNSDDSGIAKNSLGNYCTIDTKGCLDGWNCEFSEMKSYITQCLKITQKVSFNIASEASYVYILSGKKLNKNTKNNQFWKPEACGLTLLPDMSISIGQNWLKLPKLPISNVIIWVIVNHCVQSEKFSKESIKPQTFNPEKNPK